jgi:2,4-dichlorophenol 6-monooxygenase
MGSEYRPTTRPGSRLPHVWLHDHGSPVSTHDLVPMGGFLLLAGAEGAAWSAAAAKVAADAGVTIRAVQVAPDGEVTDPSGRWREGRECDESGAVLVRPDGHVAFRAASAVDDPYRALHAALAACLA